MEKQLIRHVLLIPLPLCGGWQEMGDSCSRETLHLGTDYFYRVSISLLTGHWKAISRYLLYFCFSLRELLGGEKYWPILLSSSCFPALAQLLILPWFPESPRYLLIDRGDEMKCTQGKLQLWHSLPIPRKPHNEFIGTSLSSPLHLPCTSPISIPSLKRTLKPYSPCCFPSRLTGLTLLAHLISSTAHLPLTIGQFPSELHAGFLGPLSLPLNICHCRLKERLGSA